MSEKFYDVEPEPGIDLPVEYFERERLRSIASDDASMGPVTMPRRQFLKLSGIAGGGLVLAFSMAGAPRAQAGESKGKGAFKPNSYIQIKPDGTIILMAYSPDGGQGVFTFLPMIMAEELEVLWESVTIKQSGISQEKYSL